jgi:AbrB family looped-hinge helix DNA binding protein
MALVKVKRLAQVTLPPELRRRFNLTEGDYLEAEAVTEGILLKPVTVIERRKAGKALVKLLERVHAKQPPGRRSPKQEEEWVARQVKASRKQHAARRP